MLASTAWNCLAQGQGLDVLSGGAGWVGAGLLGLVLGWLLLVHIPAKDRQLKEILEAHAGQTLNMLERKQAALEKVSDNHVLNIKTITDHCHQEAAAFMAHCDAEIQRLMALMDLGPRRLPPQS